MNKKLFNRILLTNDDGIHSEGIDALRRAAETVANEVWVVAPEHDQSGASACISLHAPLRMRELSAREYAVFGTPCDSVLMAVSHIMKNSPPDLVMSGINRGINLSDDVLFSGTTSAALTASFLGCRSIALSQAYHNPENLKWHTGEKLIPNILERIVASGWNAGECFNVNFPDAEPADVSDMEFVRQGKGSILAVEVESRIDRRNKPYFWFGFTRDRKEHDLDTDVAAVKRGAISITPLKLDRTDYKLLDKFAAKV